MEPIAAKCIEKESHVINFEVYQDFALAKVTMPMRLYSDLLMELGHGSWEAERYALNRFLREVLSKPNNRLSFFDSESAVNEALSEFGFAVGKEKVDWFNTAIFKLDESNFSESLDETILYLKSCSESFEASSTLGKIKIANSLLKKL